MGSVEDLHASASKVTGLTDFGPDDYTDGLAVLLESCARDADLTPAGAKAMRSSPKPMQAEWAGFPSGVLISKAMPK